MKFRKYLYAILFGIALTAFTVYVLLDTFVITRVYRTVETAETQTAESGMITQTDAKAEGENQTQTISQAGNTEDAQTGSETESTKGSQAVFAAADTETSDPVITDTSWTDSNISVTITTYREYDSSIYVANVVVSSPEYLKTAFACGSYGKNITAKTSQTASEVGAILAINGDYYGAQEKGYVLKNGVLYREKAASGREDLVIFSDGSFRFIEESEISAQELLEEGAEQILSFGPALVEDGAVAVTEDEEVGKAMASNPRTAIGRVDDLHYVFVVSDGRTSKSTGLTLYELAEFMASLGVKEAYNLDGGGSSTMYFNGEVINNPTTTGKISERKVSDIVYIGY